MGYYTKHTLVVKDPEALDTIKTALEEISQYGGDLFEGETYKWYDQKENCIEISKEYPNTKFAIRGEGEEEGDVWQRVYHEGKQITDWHVPPQIPSWILPDEVEYPDF